MQGDLREFALPEVLQFVSLGSRTGVLEILRRDGVYRINFTTGVITGLTADGWTLGQALTDAALLAPDVLANLLARHVTTQDLRNAMLTGGHITADEWTAFVARQVERLLYTLFDVKDGKFRFRQGTTHPGPWLQVRVTSDRAVLEGTRWSETWHRAGQMIPSRESSFERTGHVPSQSIKISRNQWRVFVALTTAGSVTQIATRAVLNETEVIEALQVLVNLGVLCPEKGSTPEPTTSDQTATASSILTSQTDTPIPISLNGDRIVVAPHPHASPRSAVSVPSQPRFASPAQST